MVRFHHKHFMQCKKTEAKKNKVINSITFKLCDSIFSFSLSKSAIIRYDTYELKIPNGKIPQAEQS